MTTPRPSSARQFLRASGTMAVLHAGATGLTFAVGILLAQMLGPRGYGSYALAMTTGTLVGLATEFGLPVLAMRETGAARASGEWGRLRGLLRWADRAVLALSAILLAATLVGCYLLWPPGGSDYLATLIWAVAMVPFVALAKLRAFVLIALDQVLASQVPIMILRPLLFLSGCGVWLWWTGGLEPQSAMAAQALGAALVMGLVALLYRRDKPSGLRAARPEYAVRYWLAACLPMGMTEGLRLLQGQLALLLVGSIAGAAQAGIYRVADAAAAITAMTASVVGTAATAMFSRLWGEQDFAGLQRVAIMAAWGMALGALALGLPLAALGHRLFPLVFGAEFGPSVPVFVVLWLAAIGFGCCGLALALATMTGHHVLGTQSLLLVAAVNLVLGLVLVPQLGAIGGALAALAGTVAGNGWCAWQLRRRIGINPTLFSRTALHTLGEGVHNALRWRSSPTGKR
jgi:O-antigen/teichoic acid export membrane protein